MSSASNAITSALDPFAVGTAYAVPVYAANARANRRSYGWDGTAGPLIVQRPLRTASLTASIVASLQTGQDGQTAVRTGSPPTIAKWCGLATVVLPRYEPEQDSRSLDSVSAM
jgi:hypothetical protein